MAVLSCIPTSNIPGFQFLYIFNTCYCLFFILAILVGVKWDFPVVLIYLSLLAYHEYFLRE